MNCLCVYAGSTFGASPKYAAAAEEFGIACARRGLTVVYGGGRVGLMGALADAALAAGGKVIGVIPRKMVTEERAHKGLTQLLTVETMHERKHRMAELADAFVALPGGIGTLEELMEILTWLQLGLHVKPVGLLNVCAYYDRFLSFLAHVRDEKFITVEHHGLLTVAADPESLLDRLAATRHAAAAKPIEYTKPK